MRRPSIRGTIFAILLAVTLASPTLAAPDVGTGVSFVVAMTGAAEAPGPGDPDGTGTATLRLNPGQEQVCWHIVVEDTATATAAHIHKAPIDASGDVVVPLSPETPSTEWSGCVDAERELILDIIQSPEEYYVNVHNAEYPAGAVRGQLG